MYLYYHNCFTSASDAVVHGYCTSLKLQWLWVGILAGKALRERQFTLEGEARYVNVRSSVHRKEVYIGGIQIF